MKKTVPICLTVFVLLARSACAQTIYYGATSVVWYSCAPELIDGANGNKTSNPTFKDAPNADYHLKKTSLCVNAGTNGSWTATDTDLDGFKRILNTIVDMGAYETDAGIKGTVMRLR